VTPLSEEERRALTWAFGYVGSASKGIGVNVDDMRQAEAARLVIHRLLNAAPQPRLIASTVSLADCLHAVGIDTAAQAQIAQAILRRVEAVIGHRMSAVEQETMNCALVWAATESRSMAAGNSAPAVRAVYLRNADALDRLRVILGFVVEDRVQDPRDPAHRGPSVP